MLHVCARTNALAWLASLHFADHTEWVFAVPLAPSLQHPAKLTFLSLLVLGGSLCLLAPGCVESASSPNSAPKDAEAIVRRDAQLEDAQRNDAPVDADAATPRSASFQAVPEYMPGQSVVLSYQIFDYEPKAAALFLALLDAGAPQIYLVAPDNAADPLRVRVMTELRAALGTKFSQVILIERPMASATPEDPTVWARDWAPITVKNGFGARKFLDFGYYPKRPIDDGAPLALGRQMGVAVDAVPMFFEGGNFMTDEAGNCFSTRRVLHANPKMTEAQVLDLYRSALGCKTTHLFPVGLDTTRHLDIWAKMVSSTTVLVNEILPETMEAAAIDHELARDCQTARIYLDEGAAVFQAKGYRVIRIPMPIPFQKYGASLVRTYSNSILVNTTAIIPSFERESMVMFDKALNKFYETQVAAAYQAAGFTPVFQPADELLRGRGALHCASMQVSP